MDEKYIALIATFDEETSNQLKQIEHSLHENGLIGTQTPGIPHHITMALYEPSLENEVKELAETVSAKTKSFDVSLSHIGLFGLKVLFLGPNVTHALLDLHEALAINNVNAGYGWTPHATLLIDEPENIHKALDLVTKDFQQINGRIEGLQLYEIDPVRLLASYRLQE